MHATWYGTNSTLCSQSSPTERQSTSKCTNSNVERSTCMQTHLWLERSACRWISWHLSLGNWRALHYHAASWLANVHTTWYFCPPVSMVKDDMESVYMPGFCSAIHKVELECMCLIAIDRFHSIFHLRNWRAKVSCDMDINQSAGSMVM